MACIQLKLNFHREGGFIQQNPSMGEGKVTTVQIGQRKIHYKTSSPHSRKHQSQFHPLLTALNPAGSYGFHWTICSRHLSRYSTSQIPGYFDFQEANKVKKKKKKETLVHDIFYNLCISQFQPSVQLYSDRKPRAKSSGMALGVGKCPAPGQCKICKCPTPGIDKAGKWAQVEILNHRIEKVVYFFQCFEASQST